MSEALKLLPNTGQKLARTPENFLGKPLLRVRRSPDKTRTECILFSPLTIHYIHHAYLLFQSKSIVNTFIWAITQASQSSNYT